MTELTHKEMHQEFKLERISLYEFMRYFHFFHFLCLKYGITIVKNEYLWEMSSLNICQKPCDEQEDN